MGSDFFRPIKVGKKKKRIRKSRECSVCRGSTLMTPYSTSSSLPIQSPIKLDDHRLSSLPLFSFSLPFPPFINTAIAPLVFSSVKAYYSAEGMSGRGSRALGLSPDYYAETPSSSLKREMSARIAGHRKSIVVGVWNVKVPKSADFPPVRFICRLRSKVSRAVRLISVHRVTPRSYSVNQSRPVRTHQVDLHRSEAIDDCIEFFNSCGSLQRSNSVS